MNSDPETASLRRIAHRTPAIEVPFWGSRVVEDISLDVLLPYLDKKSLFSLGWGLTGSQSAQLVRDVGEPRLRHWINLLRTEPAIQPKVVYGYFPAYVAGNSVSVTDESASDTVLFTFPRQTREPHRCLADWVHRFLPLQLVTVGAAASAQAAELFATDRYRDYFEFNALAAAFTEALASYWHNRIRAELKIPPDFGQRFSFGYLACPDLADRQKIVDLLKPERIGVWLSAECQLVPEFSTDALIVLDPSATYFRA